MIRPPHPSAVLVGAAGFAFCLMAGAPVLAESAAGSADVVTAAEALPDGVIEDPLAPPAVKTAPLPPPPLDVMETPPAFTTEDAGGFLWSFVKSMLMLAAVLALIYLVLHKGLGRLVARTQMGKRMRVVERIALDQRRALYLVEVDGQEVLLAGTDGGIAAVPLPGAAERKEPATPARFSTDLGKTGRAPPVTGSFQEGSKVHGGDVHGGGVQGVKAREREEG